MNFFKTITAIIKLFTRKRMNQPEDELEWDDAIIHFDEKTQKSTVTPIPWHETRAFKFRQNTKIILLEEQQEEFISKIGDYVKRAQGIIKRVYGTELPITEDSIMLLDKVIDKITEFIPAEEHYLYYTDIGCLLGVLMNQRLDYSWGTHTKTGQVRLISSDGKNVVFPINRTKKRILEGADESISYYWTSTLQLLNK
ncbi:MAG: hypothetical protein AAF649_10060 [Verrucomicrobiota bacterium]